MSFHLIVATAAVRAKYGAWSAKILASIEKLGPVVDVSGFDPEKVRSIIHSLPPGDSACLMGSYDLLPPFIRSNPTANASGDTDTNIPTDAPYGAAPGNAFEEYAPSRAISRIPDATVADAPSFLKVLSFQRAVPTTPTPPGTFGEAAHEFDGAARFVQRALSGSGAAQPYLSPPEVYNEPTLPQRISQKGRIHILLHGADRSPSWAYLYGRKSSDPPGQYPKALSCRILDLCDMRGAITTFSSCYSAMLDTGDSEAPARSEANQVALACLGHGSKVVIGATRSNWISMSPPFDGFGPRLVAEFWRLLSAGTPAAEALRQAKRAYLATLTRSSDLSYARKTVLQTQCYGHPEALL